MGVSPRDAKCLLECLRGAMVYRLGMVCTVRWEEFAINLGLMVWLIHGAYTRLHYQDTEYHCSGEPKEANLKRSKRRVIALLQYTQYYLKGVDMSHRECQIYDSCLHC